MIRFFFTAIILTVFSLLNADTDCGRGIKLNDERVEGDAYYLEIKRGSQTRQVKFLFEDLFVSIEELQNIFQFNNSEKYFEKYEYLGIDRTRDKDFRSSFHKRFFEEIVNANFSRVDGLVEYFHELSLENNWTREELSAEVVRFVQLINYERPLDIVRDRRRADNYYDFFTPNQLMFYENGDCDTKAVLLGILLKRLGIDTVILWLDRFQHVMVGVNINSSGYYYEYGAKKYYYIEVTAVQDIGQIYAGWHDRSAWQAVPLS